jgi:hypothetical protein
MRVIKRRPQARRNPMKKIIVASFALALAALQGCSTPCEDGSNRQLAALEACGFQQASEGEGEGEAPECTEAAGALALCTAACYEATPCVGMPGATDFDATSDEFTAFTECTAACAE